MKRLILVLSLLWPLFSIAQVAYTDIVPDYYQNSTGYKDIDLDQNGTADIRFNLIIIDPMFDVWFSVKTDSIYADVLIDTAVFSFIKKLDAGATINASGTWKNGNQLPLAYLTSGSPEGPWPGSVDKYLAIRLKKNNQYHYGWLRLNMNSKVNNFTLKDYAYQLSPGQEIKTGDKGTGLPAMNPAGLQWHCDEKFVYLQQVEKGMQAELYDMAGHLVSIAGEENSGISLAKKGSGLFVLLLKTHEGIKPYKLQLN